MPAMTLLQLTPDKYIEFPSIKLASVSVNLFVKNVSDRSAVAYKIKTTAPKNYLVRPSSGIIAPGEEQEVQIVLQPQQSIPSNNLDRFLVQATEVDSMSVSLSKDFWTSVSKNQLQDQRLSVVFKQDEAASATGAAISGIAASPAPFSTAYESELRRPAGPPPSGGADFEAKYNDVLQYCLALEKQKANLTKDLDCAHKQITTLTDGNAFLCRNCGGKADAASRVPTTGVHSPQQPGFELWQVVAMIVGVVIMLKLFNLL